jgi:hypothetical protein
MMRPLMLVALIGLTGCHSDWRARAVEDAESIVREQVKDPSAQFTRVQFTGDAQTGQTCGYVVRKTADGGEVSTRFIVFIDGGAGQNPFMDDPSMPYPTNKDDFDLNWHDQCVSLGYNG